MPIIVLDSKVEAENTNESGYDFYPRRACWLKRESTHLYTPLQGDIGRIVTYKYCGYGCLGEGFLAQNGNSGKGSQKEIQFECKN